MLRKLPRFVNENEDTEQYKQNEPKEKTFISQIQKLKKKENNKNNKLILFVK